MFPHLERKKMADYQNLQKKTLAGKLRLIADSDYPLGGEEYRALYQAATIVEKYKALPEDAETLSVMARSIVRYKNSLGSDL